MILTCHWSATGPVRLRDYHIELALTADLPEALHADLLRAQHPGQVDFEKLRALFTIWKNDPFTVATDYGTWRLNHDPNNGEPDIEIGALCMANATTTNWGRYPFTIAHAWMMAGIAARICALKNIDCNGTFSADVEPSVLQNGPIAFLSTHAERAIQTYDPPDGNGGGAASDTLARTFGYFLGSGDPDLRWDLTVLDVSDAHQLATTDARGLAKQSAAWIRRQAHEIKAAGITDYWGLDKGVTP